MRDSSQLTLSKRDCRACSASCGTALNLANPEVDTTDSFSNLCDSEQGQVFEEMLIRPHSSQPAHGFTFSDKRGAGRLTNGLVPIGCEGVFDDRTFHGQ